MQLGERERNDAFERDAFARIGRLYAALRPLLFRIDAETAHRLVLQLLRAAQRVLERRDQQRATNDERLEQRVMGMHFPNPIGLAAGFDKDAELPHVWAALGFGFAELGTVTALAQPGNPRPRLFRLPADHALINRLGFNNRGAAAVAGGLAARLRRRLQSIPLGINIGKSKVTPIDTATGDYLASLRLLFPHADYVTVNVSSPNTPGLRDLQAEEQLTPLVAALQEENHRLAAAARTTPRPLLLKVSPDLAADALEAIARVAERHRLAGVIATNTTVDRPRLRTPAATAEQTGGLSGLPLRDRATAVIRLLHRHIGGRIPIVGVGGVFTADDAYAKIRAGASLIQVYTGFIYEGPALPRRLCRDLSRLLQRDGYSNVAQAVGTGRDDAP